MITGERMHWTYIVWTVYLHISGGEGKVSEQREVRKKFLLHNMQNNCS